MLITNRRIIGAQHEKLASDYLIGAGYHPVRKNFYTRTGEIDLIFLTPDHKALVFVEVRSSNQKNPLLKYSLGKKKRKNLRGSISLFKRSLFGKSVNFRTLPSRVDVIWICTGTIEHWKNVEI